MRLSYHRRSPFPAPANSRRLLVKAMPTLMVEQLENRRMLSGSAATPAGLTSAITATTTISAGTAATNAMSNITNVLGVDETSYDAYATTTQTASMITAAGLNVFRYIDGNPDDSHFNVDPGVSWGAESPANFGQLVTSVGGTGIVCVNYGSGSPQEAIAELAYMDGQTNDTTVIGSGLEWNDTAGAWQSVNWQTVGYWAQIRAATPLAVDDGMNFLRLGQTAPFTGITDWEIGNEQYGSYAGGWETDHHGTAGPGGVSTGTQNNPATYAQFCEQFATMATGDMNLPAISIGIDSGSPIATDWNSWTKNVLLAGQTIGFVPGFISDHIYMQSPEEESDSYLLNDTVSDPSSNESGDGPLDWSTRYSDYESLLAATLGSGKAASVKVLATEFNSCNSTGTNPGAPGNYDYPGKQSTSLVNGLFVADSLGSMMNSDYSAGVFWDLRNDYDTTQDDAATLYGWRQGGDLGMLGDPNNTDPPATGPYVAYPTYYAEQLVSKIAQSGGEVLSADNSDTSDMSVYAVKEADGDLDLLVINKNSTSSISNQFDLTAFQPSVTAQVWQYGQTQDIAQENSATGASALVNFSSTLNLNGSNFSYSFPAYSMTVLDLTAANVKATPTFSNLSASSSINYGTATITFSGVIAAGASIPPSSEVVAITLNGVTDDAAINAMGSFSTTFDTSTLPASTTPYPVTYAYAGDTNFNPVTDNTTTVTVNSRSMPAITVTSPGNQTAIAGQNQLFTLGSFTQTNTNAPYTVTVNWGDMSSDSIFTVSAAGTISSTAHTYASIGPETVTITVTSFGLQASGGATFGITVAFATPITPAFSNLSVSSSIPQATPMVSFYGTIAAGTSIPPDTETVAITLNGVTENAAIDSQGGFVVTFNTSTLPASNTPYQVTYAYAGDASFNALTDNTTTTLLVMPTNSTETSVWRLYSPVTKEHLYTADPNEYATLATRGWVQEGLAYEDYTGLVTIDGVTAEPLYRLYNIPEQQHLWTTDPNEYNTLKNFVGTWSVDGISGYIFPANGNTSTSLIAVPGSAALYRMSWPFNPSADLHLWTTDLNEYDTDAATYGWTKEGVIGYVM